VTAQKAETNNPDAPPEGEPDADLDGDEESEVDDSEGAKQSNNDESEEKEVDVGEPEESEIPDEESQPNEEETTQSRLQNESRGSARPVQQSNSRRSTEEIAMQCVKDYEKEKDRKPIDVSEERPSRGFDIESRDPETNQPVRYIEVKGRSSTGYVELTNNEWKIANENPSKYWVYIVAETKSNPVLYAIPARELSTEEIPRFRVPEDEWRSNVEERMTMD